MRIKCCIKPRTEKYAAVPIAVLLLNDQSSAKITIILKKFIAIVTELMINV